MTTVNSTCKSYGDKRNICSANCRADDATEGWRYNFRICAEITELLEINQKHQSEDDFFKAAYSICLMLPESQSLVGS